MSDPRVIEAFASGRVPPEFIAADLEKNYDTPAVVVIVIATVLAALFVFLRILSRKFVVKRFGLGLDDGLALVSLVSSIFLEYFRKARD